MTTPIERGAEAGARASRGITTYVNYRDVLVVRAVFESIEEDPIAAIIDANLSAMGVSIRDQWHVSSELAAAIKAHLLGEVDCG